MKIVHITTTILIIMMLMVCSANLGKENNLIFRTIHVGGYGPGNYSTIQDAIDEANPGDIVYIYSGIYNETIYIEKTLSLVGEDKNTTIIYSAKPFQPTVEIRYADLVVVKGLTIKNPAGIALYLSGNNACISQCRIEDSLYGIKAFNSNNCKFSKNIFINNSVAVYLYGSISNVLLSNTFLGNVEAIELVNSRNSILSDNILKGGSIALEIYNSDLNFIQCNLILYNHLGIYIIRSIGNKIIGNTIGGCHLSGIVLDGGYRNVITKNNFIKNYYRHAYFNKGFNIWLRNYWGRPRLIFLIPGKIIVGGKEHSFFAVDPCPAKSVFQIRGENV